MDVPLNIAIQRDPKGLYQKALNGELKDFTGVDAPYEAPENPEIHLFADQHDIESLTELRLSAKILSIKLW